MCLAVVQSQPPHRRPRTYRIDTAVVRVATSTDCDIRDINVDAPHPCQPVDGALWCSIWNSVGTTSEVRSQDEGNRLTG